MRLVFLRRNFNYYFLMALSLNGKLFASDIYEAKQSVANKHKYSEFFETPNVKRLKLNPAPFSFSNAKTNSCQSVLETVVKQSVPKNDLFSPTPLDIIEIRLHIFSYLPVQSLLTMRLICHQWHQNANQQMIDIFIHHLKRSLPSETLPLYILKYPNFIEEDLLNFIQELTKPGASKSKITQARTLNEELIQHGNLLAIKRRIGSSNEEKYQHKYGYLFDINISRIFNDELCHRGYRTALHHRIEGLKEGKYGYLQDTKLATLLEEQLIVQGDQDAIENKFERLYAPVRAYEIKQQKTINVKLWSAEHLNLSQNTVLMVTETGEESTIKYFEAVEALRNFNESLVARDYLPAIKRKVEGLTYGLYGYLSNKTAACLYNEDLIDQGNEHALWRKIDGMAYGMYGYTHNQAAAVALNEELIAQGNLQALKRKTDGLKKGLYGYEKDERALRALNNSLIAAGDKEALTRRIAWIAQGKYGYIKDENAARNLNDELVDQGDTLALKRKIEGLTYGRYGYTKNESIARLFIEKFVEHNHCYAIEFKLLGLEHNLWGYKKSWFAFMKFNEQLCARSNPDAIARKLNGLINGQYGYKKNLTVLRHYIEELLNTPESHISNIRTTAPQLIWRIYLIKTIGLTYGLYSYQKNIPEAITFVRQYKICPYVFSTPCTF